MVVAARAFPPAMPRHAQPPSHSGTEPLNSLTQYCTAEKSRCKESSIMSRCELSILTGRYFVSEQVKFHVLYVCTFPTASYAVSRSQPGGINHLERLREILPGQEVSCNYLCSQYQDVLVEKRDRHNKIFWCFLCILCPELLFHPLPREGIAL